MIEAIHTRTMSVGGSRFAGHHDDVLCCVTLSRSICQLIASEASHGHKDLIGPPQITQSGDLAGTDQEDQVATAHARNF